MSPVSEGERLRDLGIGKVASRNSAWIELVIAGAQRVLRRGEIVTGETILQRVVTSFGVPPPSHHNARGAVCRIMALRGMLKRHGIAKAEHEEAHARLVRTWEVL